MSGWFVAESGRSVSFDFATLYSAYIRCRQRKRSSPQAQRYEVHLLDNLLTAVQRLQRGVWQPGRSVSFVTLRPKAREIHAAPFADRVIHHWLVPRLERLYEPVFIHDSYANRSGKGTHAAVKRLQHFMRSIEGKQEHNRGERDGYYLQLDIRNFFYTIDKPILFRLLQKRLGKAVKQHKIDVTAANQLRQLCHTLLKADPTAECIYHGTPEQWRQIPAHKRMSRIEPDKGLPIGNLTSQFFANLYLNELDQFVKHQLKCRYYLRYVDDFILLHPDKQQLKQWHSQIATFLQQQLKLLLKPEHTLQPISNGANFLGYIVRPHYRLVRRRVVGNLREKLTRYEQKLLTGTRRDGVKLVLQQDLHTHLQALLASYFGHFRHANSHHLITSIFHRYPWLLLLFDYSNGHLNPLWQPCQVSSYRSQIRYFRRRFPTAELILQRGTERDCLLPPQRLAPLNPNSPLNERVTTVNIIEEGYLKGGLKRRRIYSITLRPGVNPCTHPLSP